MIDFPAYPTSNSLEHDLDYILSRTEGLWNEIKGQRLFITGGTGFFGCWLLECFAWANDRLGLNASALVLTRNQEAFQKKVPHLAAHKAIKFQPGDVRNFAFPTGEFQYVIHAATAASAGLNDEDPLLMLDTIIEGTRQTLEFAKHCRARKFLLTSSGAVYGKQPPAVSHIREDYSGAPDPLSAGTAYGEGKRVAEFLCVRYGKQFGLETKIARCFAFVGPYLPLDIHYAVGNFIDNGLRGEAIHIKGDGTPYRSYLYAAELTIWLWTILFQGKAGEAYNVGSEQAVSVAELAGITAGVFTPELQVIIDKKPNPRIPPERYVPSTEKARTAMDLRQEINLEDALARTIEWHRRNARQHA